MESEILDHAATAEISRAQLWQWIRFGAKFDDGRYVSAALYKSVLTEEVVKLEPLQLARLDEAVELLDS